MSKDIRDLRAQSSLLSFLRYGGVLDTSSHKIVSRQSNRAIILYRKRYDQKVCEYPFSIAGLDKAIFDMNKECFPMTFGTGVKK